MIITAKIDVDITFEAGCVVVRAYDPEGDCCFTEKLGLYEMIAESMKWYQIEGTDRFKFDAEDHVDVDSTRTELADALELVEAVMENAN